MKLFKILAVFTLLFSSISPTTLVYAVSSLTPESSETANEETPTEPIAEPQVEEAPAVVDPVAEESSTEPTTPEPSTVEPQTEPAVPVPETAVPGPQIDLPNLPQYRGDLRRNGESSYQAAAQPGFNAGVSNLSELGPNVGDSISYSFTIPTHSLVYGNGTDWIAYIVGNGNIGVRFVDRMYYGRSPNHTDKYSTTYQIGRTEVVEVGGASGDLSITSNHTINNNDFTMTMSGTITRTRASNRTDYQLTAGIHNLVLGSTAVASGNEVDPTPMQVHSYYGSSVYYSIEVFDGETSTYQYEVTGNAIIRNAINGFNQGNPLEVSAGNIIKVFHGESHSRSRLMVNEVAENYSFGTPFSYYRVTDNGLVPIKHLEAEAVPQTFNLGESVDGRDLKEFVKDVQVNGVAVDASEYEVTLRSELDTSLIGTREIDIEVRTTDGLGIVQLTVPYEVKWGNSIIAQDQVANSDKTVAVLSLTEENNLPKLTATQGDGLDSFSPVASAPQAVFYRGDLTSPRFSLLTNNLAMDAQTLRSNWNNVLRQNELAYGDVLSFEVFDSAGNNLLGNKTAVSRNEQLVKEVIGYPQAFYEMTANGFNLLRINQLKVETQTIESGLTEEELSQNIESYLSTDGFDTIHVTKFIQYPDTSKAGTSNGIIEVEETLATGGTATYNYTVPFIVENSTEWIDVKIPKKLLFGTTDANKGMVSSPLYYIENAGMRNLKVSVEEINITNNTNNLELLRTADADPSAERAAAKLRMNYKTSNILVDLYESTPNQIVAELAPNEQTQFMIEGQYFGNYQQEINIGLDIRYRFEVAS
ncbi:MAG: putative mucin/carbohydrate-binding domain-containing protein [Enterococcus lactis]